MATTGLRQRKKQETRFALRSAALRLTAERGLDRVTVEDIAVAADVSPRTFFNYFSTKEEAVLGGAPDEMHDLLDVLAARPVDEEPLFALHAVLREMAGTVAQNRDVHLLRRKVLADNPSLLPRQLAAFVEFERVLVEALRARTHTARTSTADPSLVVAAAVAALRVSVDQWMSSEGTANLPELLDGAINQLAAGLTNKKSRRQR